MMREFLPSIRQLVSVKLRSEGASQGKISQMLGITQASVSLYLSADGEKAYESLASLSLDRKAAENLASLLAEDVKTSPPYAVDTLESAWTGLLGRGEICPAHRVMYPSLADCNVCMVRFAPRRSGATGAIEQVVDAIRTIESSKTFVSVMPEVSVNIAYLEGDSASPEDVVAIPGRIVRVMNTARAMRRPEFGASRHLARMLIMVRGRFPEHRGVINLRYDARMAGALKKSGVKTLEIGGPYPPGDDPVVAALRAKLVHQVGRLDAVVDRGGKGLEANVYLFGKTATEVASLAVKLSKIYSAS